MTTQEPVRIHPVERFVETMIYEGTKLSPNLARALMLLAEHVLEDPDVECLEHWSNLHAFARAQVTAALRESTQD